MVDSVDEHRAGFAGRVGGEAICGVDVTAEGNYSAAAASGAGLVNVSTAAASGTAAQLTITAAGSDSFASASGYEAPT